VSINCFLGCFGGSLLTFSRILENVVSTLGRRPSRDVASGKAGRDADSLPQKEMWTETPVHNGKKGRPVNKDRFISKMWVSSFSLMSVPCTDIDRQVSAGRQRHYRPSELRMSCVER
jgi:hypothetical protein